MKNQRKPQLPNYAELPDAALLRDRDIYRPGPFPGARSAWWGAVRRGEAPQPIRIGRITCWRWGDVREYLEKLGEGADDGRSC